MSVLINADTSDGLKFTSDTSGEIKLQSAGTDIVSVTANGIDVTGVFTVDTNTLYVDATNNYVGIGTSSPNNKLTVAAGSATAAGTTYWGNNVGSGDEFFVGHGTANEGFVFNRANKELVFGTNNNERMRIDSSGNVGIGTTSPTFPLYVNGVMRASAFVNSSNGIQNNGARTIPTDGDGNPIDNTKDLGQSNVRWDDIYATNNVINTSDKNEKQQIVSLTTSEINVAKRISSIFKTYKWNSSVESKGSNARTHVGVIAQDVQQAFADEGLDVSNYALWCSNTWWEKEITEDNKTYIDYKDEATEGYVEKTRFGIRYPELLSFVNAYHEQKLNDLEARIQALENA